MRPDYMAGSSPGENLDAIRHDAYNSGDRKITEKLHSEGSQTARERIISLLDSDTFVEIDALINHRSYDYNLHLHKPFGDGVVAGHGMLNGRRIVCFSQDKSVFSGSIGEMHGKKIVKILEFAEKSLLPIIAIWDGVGQRVEEGVSSLGPSGDVLNIIAACSGRVPIISVVLGNVVGASALAIGLSDFTIFEASYGRLLLSESSPDNPAHHSQETGSTNFHKNGGGIACLFAEDEHIALDMVSEIISFFPDNMDSVPEIKKNGDIWNRKCESISEIVPNDPEKTYDVREIIFEITDNESFLELFPNHASNIVIGLGRLDGHSVGIVANQASVMNGFLDIDAAVKAARFIRTCDCFNIPLLTFVDVPGFLPEVTQEWSGLIRQGAKLFFAYSEATVPKLSVVIGKAYGEAYLAMCSKHLGSDYNIAWPSSKIIVSSGKDIINIANKKEMPTHEKNIFTQGDILKDYSEKFEDPFVLAKNGLLDDVIEPLQTREYLIRALRPLLSKKEWTPPKKHDNIPL
jgi:propionyl-CoA carboxylase beta chain